jgi:Leucine-rich repeat (LRR) protein
MLDKILLIFLILNTLFENENSDDVPNNDLNAYAHEYVQKYLRYFTYFILHKDCPSKCLCTFNNQKDFIVTLQILNCSTRSKIHELPSSFIKFPELTVEELSINFGLFNQISNYLFENYTKLKELNMSNNNIEIIPNNSFIYLKELVVLDLSKNKITNLSSTSFYGLKKLHELDLGGNQITEIQDWLFNSTIELKKLKIGNNRLKSINNKIFKNLFDIEEIYLDHNQIESLEKDFFNETNYLQILDISDNLINTVNGLFDNLDLLKSLNLKNNRLKSISKDTFKKLINLEELNLANNQISKISKDLFHTHLRSLREINLSNNKLIEIEMWPLYLSNIQYINMNNNSIQKFSNNFEWYYEKEASNLKPLNSSAVIDLQYNYIKYFDDRIIQQYGICSTSSYENFIINYLHVFRIDNNPIQCNCSNSQRLILDTIELVKKKLLKRTEQIFKAKCSDKIFEGKCMLYFEHCNRNNPNYLYATHCSK